MSSASERNFFIPSVHEGSALKIHEALQLLKINTCAFYSSIFPARLQVNAFRLFPSAYLVSFSTILLRLSDVSFMLNSCYVFKRISFVTWLQRD
ncbi:hypothetical protein T07_13889 [Trichinella nelsoni]|uniref:Uncharacterized protein n=1 Tax=Trichinella nelsoni TaxID=6336 RepID=A0A0V0RJ46_9BILA|nr:hypothetical protein T07_13889 [Trichinella nelsoni]